MDARESGGPAGAVRTPDRPEVGGPACSCQTGAPDDESREQGDAETYAVLGED
ncbi:hypothetical protein [Streptomyces rubellomurinus]|uniref:Uncharacterized protein n=1 Tax=Streptomyces sp. Y1 TaxID=3238634 RepID=A0AB39TW71_9ACTN|nr:hypothetical protein [Streptomyces rubellomurinus]